MANEPIGSTTWKLYVNFLTAQPDGTFVWIATYTTSYGDGVSLAEAERKSEGTRMTHDFPKLTYRYDDGTWPDWPGMNCVDHNAFGATRSHSWNYNTTGQVDGNSFSVDLNPNACDLRP